MVAWAICVWFFFTLLLIVKPYSSVDVRVQLFDSERIAVAGSCKYLLVFEVMGGVGVSGREGGRRRWGVEGSALSMEVLTYPAWLEG